MSAIIWGANGQDGPYLAAVLKDNGINSIGVSRAAGFVHADLSNFEAVSALINEQRPQYIFHLAADSTTKHAAWKSNYEAISTGTLHILEAVKQFSPATKVFLSGSGLQFKNEGKPIKETAPFDASSIYAATRINSVYMARYYRSLGLNVYIGYFFNHDSPSRSDRHINKKIIDTAKKIAEGSSEKLSMGDISVKKEYGFSGDIMKAVWQLVQQDAIMEAVIGTGDAHSIEEWIDCCFSLYGLNWKDHVVKSEGFVAEYKILVSDPATIFSLGWKPEVTMAELAQMMK
ncbi:MAG: GDP-mannose 4,6-dehydratase [Chitinophagaceae bacterium]